jgi:SulP family sulfate permease
MAVSKYFPIAGWLPRYTKKDWRGDLLAGLTVGVMLVPQGMAYGLLAGLPPIYGLYAGIVPLFLYAMFGSSRHLSVGPVALVSLLVLAGVSQFATPGSDAFIQLAITTALLAGMIQVVLGVLRLGFLINFLSHPVISGFTSAAAFIIGFSQLKFLLGVEVSQTNRIQDIVLQTAAQIGHTNPVTLAIGLAGIVLILLLKRIRKTLPGGLITVMLGTAVVWAADLNTYGVDIVGEVPGGLPAFQTPLLSLEAIGNLMPLALTICLISFIESLAIAKALAARHKTYRIDTNQELLALGISKIGSAFFQSFPTTGSFTRSAVNEEAGARTGMASIFAAILVSIALLFFTPLFYFLPKALLASIIVVAVIGLVDYREAFRLWKTDRRDFLTLITTFFITLTLGIQVGVAAGVVLSIALLIYRSSRPHVAVLGQLPATRYFRNVTRFEHAIQYPDKLILRFDAQLYFGNAEFFRETIERLSADKGDELKYVILDAASISDIDSTGVHTLHEVVSFLRGRGITFVMTSVIGPVRDVLRHTGLLSEIGESQIYLNVYEAISHLDADSSDVK